MKEMRLALNALLTRSNHDAFVIFSMPPTGKFVQFGGGEGELVFDLPDLPLSAEEFERAEAFLGARGVTLTESPMDSESGGEVTGHFKYFSKNLGRDVEAALELATGVFEEVYRLPIDGRLEIEEN